MRQRIHVNTTAGPVPDVFTTEDPEIVDNGALKVVVTEPTVTVITYAAGCWMTVVATEAPLGGGEE